MHKHTRTHFAPEFDKCVRAAASAVPPMGVGGRCTVSRSKALFTAATGLVVTDELLLSHWRSRLRAAGGHGARVRTRRRTRSTTAPAPSPQAQAAACTHPSELLNALGSGSVSEAVLSMRMEARDPRPGLAAPTSWLACRSMG